MHLCVCSHIYDSQNIYFVDIPNTDVNYFYYTEFIVLQRDNIK